MKLNLGCGPSGIDGWVNYDWGVLPVLSKMPWLRKLLVKINLLNVGYEVDWPRIILHNLKNKLPVKNSSVDYIYCSHVLEHFEKYETENILNECKRVLKKSGVLRIVLPDLEKMVAGYTDADSFCREFWGFDKDKKYGLIGFFIRGHQWMYDEKSLAEILKQVGFLKIKQCQFRQGSCLDIDRLDLRGHQKISMYVEVSKT